MEDTKIGGNRFDNLCYQSVGALPKNPRKRKPIDKERHKKVLELASEGITKVNIARQLSIGEATIYRILAAEKVLTGKKQGKAAN